MFAAEIPAGSISDRGVEYYVKLGDGDNVALYPPSAPERNLSFVVSDSDPIDPPSTPAGLRERQGIDLDLHGSEGLLAPSLPRT